MIVEPFDEQFGHAAEMGLRCFVRPVGHIGCCDNSPGQHATAHAQATGHPVIRSFEPGENWFFHYPSTSFFEGPDLEPPAHRPLDQSVPGPASRVPKDWHYHLHR